MQSMAHLFYTISGVVSALSVCACCRVEVLPVSTPLLPVDKVFKQDAVGIALPADVHRLQDPRVAQLHHHPLLAETQCLPVVVGLDAAHKVWLTHYHLRQQVHQGVLQKHNETTLNSGQRQGKNTREQLSYEFTLSKSGGISSVMMIYTSKNIQLFPDIDVFDNRI